MAGFFGLFDYSKEGKGVYPDDPPKGPIPTFFSILGRKFWKICTINLMYVLFSLPALLIAFFGASYVLQAFLPGLTPESLADAFAKANLSLQEGITMLDFANIQILQLYFLLAMLIVGLSLVVVGPVQAGVTYVLRNYSREEHAFIWMDFKEHAGKNLKQSLICSLISLAVTFIFVINFSFYSNSSFIGSGLLRVFLQTVIVILFLLWCMMQMYIYPMMVTFELSIKQMMKNCLLFSIMRLPLNLLILILSALILFVIPGIMLFMGYGISVLLAIVWYVFLAFGLNLLMTNFFTYRGLDKYMISRIKASESLNDESEENTEEAEEDTEEAQEDTGDAGSDKQEDGQTALPPSAEDHQGGMLKSPTGAHT
ncbi:MAG: YesL family protein [Clostridiaceae bacterium]|nr:YesL family protein [Clostridiaceae bacterium]